MTSDRSGGGTFTEETSNEIPLLASPFVPKVSYRAPPSGAALIRTNGLSILRACLYNNAEAGHMATVTQWMKMDQNGKSDTVRKY